MELKNILNRYTFLKTASDIAGQMNVKLFIVGGFVRDIIIKREKFEIDFLVLGDGVEYAENFAKKLGIKNISIFKTYGTAHFKYEDFDLEFVGARKESYKRDSRKPDVKAGTFEEDISRRDFTINTLAISLNEDFGALIDTYNGLKDIRDKILKTPIDPLITFDDDPLRIMRAIRFASQLQFNIDPAAIEAAAKLKGRLKIVSQERITDEFIKILKSPQPSVGLKLLYHSGIMEVVFPEVAK